MRANKTHNIPASNLLLVLLSILIHVFFSSSLRADDRNHGLQVEPPCWWTGMPETELQLIVYGPHIAQAEVKVKNEHITISELHRFDNPNYLFIDLRIGSEASAGTYTFIFKDENGERELFWELKERNLTEHQWQGFDTRDAIYLLMPDRFANGNPENDSRDDMLEKADRNSPDGRHGGDISGIQDHLGYIADMGFTALWINPLIENDRSAYSYHGYGITDFYKVDARFGTNEDYRELVEGAHNMGLKVIMDMIFNHCDTSHYLVADPPMDNWVNTWETFTRSNFRGEVKVDPYASDYDKIRMGEGWFDTFMADLNQSNPYVLKYLTQNTIWWIEYLGIDAIRMDTYPYPDKAAMSEWAASIIAMYPDFTILGEIWLQRTSHTAYWQAGETNYDRYNSHLPVVTDFPLHYAVKQAFNEKEGWTEGLRRLYYVLSEDFLYPDPGMLVVFPDNHDVDRYFTAIGEDMGSYKLGLAFLLTIPRIPEIYYGTEILMTGEEHSGHGYIRQDFPGGWKDDRINAFTGEGLSEDQQEAQNYLKTLLNWRKTAEVVHTGSFKHFIPEEDVYVYFRANATQSLMVILNSGHQQKELLLERFREGWEGYTSGVDIISNKEYYLGTSLSIPARTALILELKK